MCILIFYCHSVIYCHSERSEESADGNRTSASPSMTLKLFFQRKDLFNLFESSLDITSAHCKYRPFLIITIILFKNSEEISGMIVYQIKIKQLLPCLFISDETHPNISTFSWLAGCRCREITIDIIQIK